MHGLIKASMAHDHMDPVKARSKASWVALLGGKHYMSPNITDNTSLQSPGTWSKLAGSCNSILDPSEALEWMLKKDGYGCELFDK